MSESMKDSAGNERTEEQVRAIIGNSMRTGVTDGDLLDALEEAVGGLRGLLGLGGSVGLPLWLTRCPCHGLWYDECEAYR